VNPFSLLKSRDKSAATSPERVECVSVRPWLLLPGVDEPGGCADLTLGRVYRVVGTDAGGSFYRVVDDSGEDFLYPKALFRVV